MKKIVLITTGGTIASKKNTGGLLVCTDITGDELAKMVDFPADVAVEVHNLFQVPSMHITFEMLITLRNKVLEVFQEKSVDGVVITHGTDSLEETAYFLDLTINDQRPVVVTGSQRSVENLGSDALTNLRHAVLAAESSGLKHLGTTILFNERIWCAKHVKKIDSGNLQGFGVYGFGYLGTIENNQVNLFQRPIRRETYNIKNKLPEVDIIKSYLDADSKFIEAAKKSKVKGIILEGTGKGQIAPLMRNSVIQAVKEGIKVVITTSVETGRVGISYDDKGSAFDLSSHGVILGGNYNSKKARIKLAVLLAANIDNLTNRFLI